MDDISRLKNQPKYKIGQGVIVTIVTTDTKTNLRFENNIVANIRSIEDTVYKGNRSYKYGISTELSQRYYEGKPAFTYIFEAHIKLEKQ